MLIYVVTNSINDKVYVGQHRGNRAEHRLKRHLYEAAHCSQTHFHRAIRKYGASNFRIQVLCNDVGSLKELDNLERIWIILLDSRNTGYNLARGGSFENHVGAKGYKHTEITRNQISVATKGRQPSIPKGSTRSEDFKKKMRKPKSKEHKEAMKGPKSASHREAIRASKQVISEETRYRLRKSAIARGIRQRLAKTEHLAVENSEDTP